MELIKNHVLKGSIAGGALNSVVCWFSFVKKVGDTYSTLSDGERCRTSLISKMSYRQVEVDKDKTRLIITFKCKTNLKYFIKNLNLLHAKEEKGGVEKTSLLKYDDYTLIVEGDKRWQKNYWKHTLYTFYLKCLMYKNGAPTGNGNVEVHYYHALIPKEDVLLCNLKHYKEYTSTKTPKGYPYFYWSPNGNAGFYSICNGNNKPMWELLESNYNKKGKK